jgi:hypothetical protein
MSTVLNMTKDVNGSNAYGLVFTDTAYSCTLVASTDTTLTVPSIAALGGPSFTGTQTPKLLAVFIFDPGTSTWVANNHTASNPAGNTFAATTSELNPAARMVKGGDVLHFYSTGTGVNVSVLFYIVQNY